MEIKNTAIWLCLLFSVAVASCQEISEEKYEIRGSVTHEDRTPVESARMMSFYIKRSAPGSFVGEPTRTEIVETDSSGKATLEFTSLPAPDGAVAFGKKGYYGTTARAIWKSAGPKSWKAEVSAILKPVKNPIPMSSRTFGNTRIRVPKIGEDYGYDLELCEFLPPHGKGKHPDIIFHVTGSNDGKGKGKIQMTIRGNGEKTGFVEFLTPERERGSAFISDYSAPANGFTNSLSFKFDSNDIKAAMNQPKDQNYYFRVRCQLNPDGTIKSCHYGKLYGPFTFWNIPIEQGGVASFGLHTSYFNSTPNDRNVEFDPKRNLAPGGNVQRP